jgi:hypothetical protein
VVSSTALAQQHVDVRGAERALEDVADLARQLALLLLRAAGPRVDVTVGKPSPSLPYASVIDT